MDAVREGPILFSGPMVIAILDGGKTQTRRLVGREMAYLPDKPYPWNIRRRDGVWDSFKTADALIAKHCRFQVGMNLWVRETWRRSFNLPDGIEYRADNLLRYFDDNSAMPKAKAEHLPRDGNWRPSIYMPRWASRLLLRVTNVRVQRLQEISEEDARAEGAPRGRWTDLATSHSSVYVGSFALLWDSINAKRAPWASNPWVWAVTFEVAK